MISGCRHNLHEIINNFCAQNLVKTCNSIKYFEDSTIVSNFCRYYLAIFPKEQSVFSMMIYAVAFKQRTFQKMT
ncbi:unnamed protein product [Brugia timori]|uniref:Uncharacterized protein n=1 Tax=Brugia timori TaxID=42155 RepID=A0A3P7ZH33_9BILA|nr:unnamed protein product [Brugia timori]